MKKLLIAFISLWTISAMAGLPPTTSKVSGDSTDLTTFKFRFPNFTGTHSGTTLSLGVNGVAGGGTGVSSLTLNNVILGNGSSAVQFVAPGASGNALVSDGTTWMSGTVTSSTKIAVLTDVKSSGTDGGTSTSGSFLTRTLNTISDPYSIVTSLSSNQFTLPAGTYAISASSAFFNGDRTKIKIRNITDSTDAIIGLAASVANSTTGYNAFLFGTITIASSKTFELQYRVTTGTATNGLGLSASFGVNEVYSHVEITKMQ